MHRGCWKVLKKAHTHMSYQFFCRNRTTYSSYSMSHLGRLWLQVCRVLPGATILVPRTFVLFGQRLTSLIETVKLNLVPRVLKLFGQWGVAWRDSGVTISYPESSPRWPKSLRTLGTRLCEALIRRLGKRWRRLYGRVRNSCSNDTPRYFED